MDDMGWRIFRDEIMVECQEWDRQSISCLLFSHSAVSFLSPFMY